MMSNSEIFMVVYSVIGCIVVTINLPICCLIYFSPGLRPSKELILIGGLCLADSVQALANILAGVQRLLLYARNGQGGEESSFRCYIEPFNVLFFFGYHLVGIMTMLVSLDRLIAVLLPTRHDSIFSRTNGILLTIGTFVLSGIAFFVCFIFQIKYPTMIPIECFGSKAYLPAVWEYVHHIRLMPVLASILLYIPISYKLYRIVKVHATGRQYYQNKKLVAFTKTVGFLSLSALFLLVIPDILVTYFAKQIGESAQKAMFILGHSKAIVNIFIFTFRHAGLRKTCINIARQVFGLMTGRRMNLVTVQSLRSKGEGSTHRSLGPQ